ncbi:MAG: c-type cytochrome [Acidobacteria bacterium]|nr:c-type cytochrome [Acidobacteriota bacterium]
MLRAAAALVTCAGLLAQNDAPGLILQARDARTERTWVVPRPDFHLDSRESLHPALGARFQAVWSGFLTVLEAGEYEFDAGKAELRIDASEGRQPVLLAAGRHAIQLRFQRTDGPAAVQFRWKGARFPWEPVPGAVLSHRGGPAADAGRKLVREYGCANCHAAPGLARPAPVLDGVGTRTNAKWLHAWLAAPQSFRNGATMPVSLNAGERADVAAYLATLQDPAPARTSKRVNEVLVGKGNELFGTIGCIACHQQPGLGLDGLGSKYSLASLTAFLRDPAKVEPTGRMPSMLLDEDDAVAIAAHLLNSRNPQFEADAPSGDAANGKAVFESTGCAACHAVQGVKPALKAKPLSQLSAENGCLAAAPAAGLPRYTLSAGDRRAISSFLREYAAAPDSSPAAVFELSLRLEELRCAACHKIESTGPLASLAEPVPVLTGVGAKLKTAWIERVLTAKERIRSSHEIRMPHYSVAQVREIAPALAKLEGIAPGDGPSPPKPVEARQTTGNGLLGTNPRKQGMACIGCHDWGSNKSLGEEGPQLINLTARMRWDWYERWMLNPARILSGTSMPNYFPSQPREKALDTIALLWAGMELGRKAPLPDGYRVAESAESKPAPGKHAVVVRWDMPEATPAAIAVGLPGGLSYCFDAGTVNLLYAWSGGFLDMSGTLLRKTDEKKLTPVAALIGNVFWRANGVPFRAGAPGQIPQRRFRGYRMVEGRPVFHYDLDGIRVEETLVPEAGALRREIVVSRVEGPLWFDGEAVPAGSAVKIVRRLEVPQ